MLRRIWDRLTTLWTVVCRTTGFVFGWGDGFVCLHGTLAYKDGKAVGMTARVVVVGDMRVCHEMLKEQAERISRDVMTRLGAAMKQGAEVGVPKEVLDKIKGMIAERMGVDPATIRIADTDETHDGMKVAHVYRSDCPCAGCARGRVEHGEALPEDRAKMN